MTDFAPPPDYQSLVAEAVQQAKTAAGVQSLRQANDEAFSDHDEAYRRRTEELRREFLIRTNIEVTAQDIDLISSGAKLKPTDALRTAFGWWRTAPEGGFLILLGGTGCGKTMSSAYLLSRHGGLSMPAEDWARVCSSNWGEDIARRDELLNYRGLVTVEDVGTERNVPIEKVQHALYRLINARQRFGHTIITANLKRAEFEELLDARVRSRLMQVGKVYSCKGEDLRRTA